MTRSDDDSRSAAVGRKRKAPCETTFDVNRPATSGTQSSRESGEISSFESGSRPQSRASEPHKEIPHESGARLDYSEPETTYITDDNSASGSRRDSEESSGDDASEGSLDSKMQRSSTANEVRLVDLPTSQQVLQKRYFKITDPNALVRCLSCAGMGHVHVTCAERVCKHCGLRDEHSSNYCPAYRKCGRCRQRGHDAHGCHVRSRAPGGPGDPCDICGEFDHVEELCPQMANIYLQEDKAKEKTGLINRIPELEMLKACYWCGKCTHGADGHWGDDCPYVPRVDRIYPQGTWSRKHASKYIEEGTPPGHPENRSPPCGRPSLANRRPSWEERLLAPTPPHLRAMQIRFENDMAWPPAYFDDDRD